MDEEELEQSNKVDIGSFFGSIQSIDRVAKNALNSSNTSLKASRSNLDLIKAIQASFESLRAEVQEISRYILIEQDERSKILTQREQAAAQREDDIQKGIFNAEDTREKALTDDKPFSGKNRFLEGITGGLSNIIEQNQDLIAGAGAATILGAIPFNFGRLVPGSGDADTVNAKLTPGEFVVPKNTVENLSPNFFKGLISSSKNNEKVESNDYFVEGETELVDDGDGMMFYNPKDVRNYLKENNFYIAIETNGTIEPPIGIDWICVSPKPNTKLKITEGDELKFIYPQPNFKPEPFEKLSFKHFYIQPMDSEKLDSNTNRSIKFCMKNANWKISLQSHKILGIQ